MNAEAKVVSADLTVMAGANPARVARPLPKDLPEFIEVDLSTMEAGQSVHISQIKLPVGVELVQHGEGDPVVATALLVKGAAEAEGEGEQQA